MGATQACRQTPGEQAADAAPLDVVVLFTNHERTLEAMRAAAGLARGLRANIRLLVPLVVPYPLPFDKPPVDPRHLDRQCRSLARASGVDTAVEIRFCRDAWDALRTAVGERSIVVIGLRNRWWPAPEKSYAKRLRGEGRHVVLAQNETRL